MSENKENEPIDVSEHGRPGLELKGGIVIQKPEFHIAVICARRGIDMTKLGRNEPCPCNSGKKFKKCCIEEHPENLCYQFAKSEKLFHCANMAGDFSQAEEHAAEHNRLLAILRLLDPGTFKEFEELEVVKL